MSAHLATSTPRVLHVKNVLIIVMNVHQVLAAPLATQDTFLTTLHACIAPQTALVVLVEPLARPVKKDTLKVVMIV